MGAGGQEGGRAGRREGGRGGGRGGVWGAVVLRPPRTHTHTHTHTECMHPHLPPRPPPHSRKAPLTSSMLLAKVLIWGITIVGMSRDLTVSRRSSSQQYSTNLEGNKRVGGCHVVGRWW